jgi:hypothetical protein
MRLNNDRKGIWPLVYPLSASLDADQFATSPAGVETNILYVVKGSGGIQLSDGEHDRSVSDFSEIVARCVEEAEENGRQSIRVVVMDFHDAPVVEQCALIKKARSVQESTTSISCQFVFCGQWSYYAFRSAYREIHGHTISPPTQSKDILQVTPWCANDVLKLLDERRLMGAYPSDIELVASEFLVEQTAGAKFLIYQAVAHMEELGGNWTSNIEQVLDELAEAPVVTTAVSESIHSLDAHQKSELTKLLRVQRLIRDVDSIDAEQLWLAGLVQRWDLGSGRQCIQIAGPLINTVVRRFLHSEATGSVAIPEDLCFEREAISTAAYRRIAQIENMLRNLIVSQWYAERDNNWYQNLGGIKTVSRDLEEREELRELLAAVVRSELAACGLAPESSTIDHTTPAGPPKRRPQESLLDSARDWQRRQHDDHSVELARNNLMHFLTTESLKNVLVNKRNGLHGKDKPFRKEFLVAAFEEYVAIRSAVAHNQPLKLSTISRLDDLHRKFIEWLTVFADQNDELKEPGSD